MADRILFSAVLFIFTFQVLNAHVEIETDYYEALLETEQVFHEIEGNMDMMGADVSNKVVVGMEVIVTESRELLDKALEKLEAIEAAIETEIETEIQKPVERIVENRVDINYCISGERAAVEQLKQHTREELATCVSEQVKVMKSVVDDIILKAKMGLTTAKQYEEDYTACNKLVNPKEILDCIYQGAFQQLAQRMRKLTYLMSVDWSKAQKMITQTSIEIPACVDKKMVKAEVFSAAIVKGFKECVMDKINNKEYSSKNNNISSN